MFIHKKYSKQFFLSHCISLLIIFLAVNAVSLFKSNYTTVILNLFSIALGLISIYFSYCWYNGSRNFKPHHNFETILLFFTIMFLGFFSYAFYWLSYSFKLSFLSLFIQLTVFLLAYFSGYFRFERELQAIELRKGIKLLHRTDPNLEKGVIYLKKHAGNAFTYKKRFDNWTLEILFRLIKYGYLIILGLGLLFGSGSSLIIVRIVENYLPSGSDVSPHNIAMYGFSLVVIPILSYYLPAIMSAIRWWKNLEVDIQDRYGKVVYVWPDEQMITTEEGKS